MIPVLIGVARCLTAFGRHWQGKVVNSLEQHLSSCQRPGEGYNHLCLGLQEKLCNPIPSAL